MIVVCLLILGPFAHPPRSPVTLRKGAYHIESGATDTAVQSIVSAGLVRVKHTGLHVSPTGQKIS